jgi:hypothetical protein
MGAGNKCRHDSLGCGSGESLLIRFVKSEALVRKRTAAR